MLTMPTQAARIEWNPDSNGGDRGYRDLFSHPGLNSGSEFSC
jgi:hypothetical protein